MPIRHADRGALEQGGSFVAERLLSTSRGRAPPRRDAGRRHDEIMCRGAGERRDRRSLVEPHHTRVIDAASQELVQLAQGDWGWQWPALVELA